MKRFDIRKLDRTTRVAGAVSLVSLVLFSIGLFAVVSAVTSDDVQLPDQGTIDEIVEDNGGAAGGDGAGQAAVPEVPHGPAPVRIAVPNLYIDAPIVTLDLQPETNVPQVPERGDQVAWYRFSASPGLNSNAVFAGHVDWQTARGDPIPGAFYRLRELRIGDSITVTLEDGAVIEYLVTGNVATEYDDPNVGRSMSLTSKDVITLITCGGSWIIDRSKDTGGTYSHRVIVRAERMADDGAAAAELIP